MLNVAAAEIEEIYESSFTEIYRYCAYRLFSAELAEDAAAAVFLRLVEKYAALRGRERREVRAWLYGTASNVAARHLRDARRRRRIAAELARERDRLRARPEDNGRLDWPVLYEAMHGLKRKDQDVIVLRYFQGLQTSEIAEALGVKHTTVRVRLSRAVKKLKDALGPRFGEYDESG